jgi:hypothetical protein
MPQTPQVISSCAQAFAAAASVYSAFAFVQRRTFSDELMVREPERDLLLGRLRRVGAVDEVVRHQERQVAADRAGIGVGRIRGPDRPAARGDGALPFEDERERRARGDELDELAEERLLAVDVVVPLGEIAVDADELARAPRSGAGSRPRAVAAWRPA